MFEEDKWCYLYGATLPLKKLAKRNWTQTDFRVTEDEIRRLAEALGLVQTSASDLLIPPAQFYCQDVIQQMQRRDPPLDYYVPNSLTFKGRYGERPAGSGPQTVADFLSAALPGSRYLIQASGGVGKTTLCAYFCREAADRRLRNDNNPFPVLIQFRDYRYEEGGLPRLINDALRPLGLEPVELNRALEEESFLWFMDGINEAPEKERENIFRELRSFARANTQSQIVATTRPLSVSEVFGSDFVTFELLPFTEEQISEYLKKRRIPESFRTQMAPELAKSPLFLSLLISLGPTFVPDARWNNAKLYRKLADELLQRELEKRQIQSRRDLLWSSLYGLAHFLEDEYDTSYEISKERTAQWIREKHFITDTARSY